MIVCTQDEVCFLDDEHNNSAVSRLFDLVPLGIGTGLIEGLSGYISRLAESHCVTAGYIVDKELAPLMNKQYLLNIAENGGTRFYENSCMIVGTGRAANEFSRALMHLTGRTDLVSTTMLPLYNIVPSRHLVRKQRAWCARCYEEQKQGGGDIYDMLIWALQVVEACPIHRTQLTHQCPQCGQGMLLLERKTRPGYCARCGSWLGDTDTELLASNQDVTVATMATQLIEHFSQHTGNEKPSVPQFFEWAINHKTEGNNAAFARLIGVAKGTLAGWVHGNNLPPLPLLLKSMVISEATPQVLFNATGKTLGCSRHKTMRSVSCGSVSGFFSDLLKTAEPLSLKQVSTLLRKDRKMVRQKYPEFAKAITKRFATNREMRKNTRREHLSKLVKEAVTEISRAGIYPTRRLVEKRLQKPGVLRESALRKVWNQAVKEDMHYDG